MLAALAVLAAAVSVSCGDGEPPGPVSPSTQPEPAAAETQPSDPPRLPPPPTATPGRTLDTAEKLIAASTVIVTGTPLEEAVPDRTCRLPPRVDSPGCYFQRFQVTEVLAGEFIDGTNTPQEIELRFWAKNIDGGDVEPGDDYLLFLYPYEFDRGTWFGDYQVAGLFAGQFKIRGDGRLLSLYMAVIGDLAKIRSVDYVREKIREDPGRLGTTVLRAR